MNAWSLSCKLVIWFFITFAAASTNGRLPGSGYYTFNEMGFLNRTGSTGVDAVNLVRCLLFRGLPANTVIKMDDMNRLVMARPESGDYSNETKWCYFNLAFGLSFRTHSASDPEDLSTPVGTIGSLAHVDATELLSRAVRNTVINPQQLSSTFASTLATSTSVASSIAPDESIGNSTHVRRGKYLAYYDMRVTQDKRDCISNELVFSPSDECISFMGSFNGYEVKNINSRRMIINIWPHHDCRGGNIAVHYLGPGEDSGCMIRTTYSWYGDFESDGCYGHESDSDCADSEGDVLNNTYDSHQTLYVGAWWDNYQVPPGCCGSY